MSLIESTAQRNTDISDISRDLFRSSVASPSRVASQHVHVLESMLLKESREARLERERERERERGEGRERKRAPR